ncbi:MAG: 2-dehydro-3-deoxygalactonokinase [Proteobacteria bacterium]|jgi:2-dehydro-3-deoxygalactonokinase|nr:2-dehydro-3-deoxygalactonokinase [Pseudomonadota bacterium]MDA1134640.1 2-dehydro-3-deoxygalactonokinase [Pseudomonadota bacterium]
MDPWIAVDWGTSSFRAYLITNDKVLDQIHSKDGMKFVQHDNFEITFVKLIEKWLVTNKKILILASGMLGSRQGWAEASYQKAPCNLEKLKYMSPLIKDNRFELKIYSGVSQSNPPDVMRGEETQVSGFFSDNTNFAGSICLPGTHSKWINAKQSRIENFKTYMTGELFEVISQNTVLIHSLNCKEIDKIEFIKSVDLIVEKPEIFSGLLFQLRADDLLNKQMSIISRSRLSGYLLGIELADSIKYWNNKDVVIIGDETLIELYGDALMNKVSSLRQFKSEEMVLKGLTNFKKFL